MIFFSSSVSCAVRSVVVVYAERSTYNPPSSSFNAFVNPSAFSFTTASALILPDALSTVTFTELEVSPVRIFTSPAAGILITVAAVLSVPLLRVSQISFVSGW